MALVIHAIKVARTEHPTKAQMAHSKGMPWQFSQAQSMIKAADNYTSAEMKEYNGLITWDIIPYDYFISNGAKCFFITRVNGCLWGIAESDFFAYTFKYQYICVYCHTNRQHNSRYARQR